MHITKGAVALALVTIVATACTGGGATPSPAAPTAAPATPAPSEAPATPAPTPTPDACAPENLALKAPGVLTIGTDNPAYPPYFEKSDATFAPGFEDLGYTGDPGSGKGFESAVAYAVAEQLGFPRDKVTWVVVPFTNSFAPGPKTFDYLLNQVSYKPERAEQVDLTDGYYELNQAVVALKDNPAAAAKSLADLKTARLGAMVGTTSYDAIEKVIAPTATPAVYTTNDEAIEGLKAKQVDAIVVDLPTSDFITRVQIDDGSATIVGQFAALGDTPEYFSLLLEKGSALTPCVNAALGALRDAGTLDSIATQWLPFQEAVPVLK
jgi:polar amino acid transport system substrate-binding protein